MTKKTAPKLKAEKRKVLGRKVKKLRKEGILPANIYGKKVKSQAVQVEIKPFLTIYSEIGETGVVELMLKEESKARPILIHNVQVDPVTDQPVHVDFYQVSLKEKVTSEIPVELVGESPAVKDKAGILVQQLSEVEVEALPTELPDKFSVDIGKLEKVDDYLDVTSLKVPKGVDVLTDKETVIVKIEPLTEEEESVGAPAEPVAEAEGAEVPEAGAEEGKAPVAEEGDGQSEAKPGQQTEAKVKEKEKKE